jgi:hypothetical protein
MIARDDDPRSWLLPDGKIRKGAPPFHARVLYYLLTRSERDLCKAFHELCSTGSRLCASMETYALLSGLSVRTIYDLIHGRKGFPGFIARGILTVEAEFRHPGKGRRYATPAIYNFHEAAIKLNPQALARQEARRRQPPLPGIPPPAKSGEPFDTENTRQPLPDVGPEHPATVANDMRQFSQSTSGNSRNRHPATVAENTRATTDSKASLDSKPDDTVGEGKVVVIPARAREVGSSPPPPALVSGVLENAAMPVLPQNLVTVGAAIAAIQKRFDWPYPKCCAWLMERIDTALKSGGTVNRWWFEDGKYAQALNRDERGELDRQRLREGVNKIFAQEAQSEAQQTEIRAGTRFADPNCQDCSGNGFIQAWVGSQKGVTKCHCRTDKKPVANEAGCEAHPDSGLTPRGDCYACYAERHGTPAS